MGGPACGSARQPRPGMDREVRRETLMASVDRRRQRRLRGESGCAYETISWLLYPRRVRAAPRRWLSGLRRGVCERTRHQPRMDLGRPRPGRHRERPTLLPEGRPRPALAPRGAPRDLSEGRSADAAQRRRVALIAAGSPARTAQSPPDEQELARARRTSRASGASAVDRGCSRPWLSTVVAVEPEPIARMRLRVPAQRQNVTSEANCLMQRERSPGLLRYGSVAPAPAAATAAGSDSGASPRSPAIFEAAGELAEELVGRLQPAREDLAFLDAAGEPHVG